MREAIKNMEKISGYLAAPDHLRLFMPNSQRIAGSIKNYSANETRRVDLVSGISYADDRAKARQVMRDVLTSGAKVLKAAAPVVAVHQIAESGVNFAGRRWVKSADYWDVYFAVTGKIKLALDRNGITSPFPRDDLPNQDRRIQIEHSPYRDNGFLRPSSLKNRAGTANCLTGIFLAPKSWL